MTSSLATDQRLANALWQTAYLDKQQLGELVDVIGNMGLGNTGTKDKDLLARMYEHMLGEFAHVEGRRAVL